MKFGCSVLAALVILLTTAPNAVADPSGQPAPATAPERLPSVEIRTPQLFANYYEADPAIASPGAVIVLGGSEGGSQSASRLAQRLAESGFSAIAVAYFGEDGLPPVLNEVPIEPVAAARAWLEALPGGTGAIAIMGASKGGELALIAASRDPAIRAVVAGVPSSVVWQGINMSGGATGSSWTAGGEAMIYAAYDFSQGFRGVYQLYADSLALAPEAAVIPVERINGPVLLISGEADALWPSAVMAGQIADRLEQQHFAHPVENLVYADAGHAAFGPPVQPTPQLEQQILQLGGTVEGTLAARADSWPRVLDFLRRALATP